MTLTMRRIVSHLTVESCPTLRRESFRRSSELNQDGKREIGQTRILDSCKIAISFTENTKPI
jgi:hypothetical protein